MELQKLTLILSHLQQKARKTAWIPVPSAFVRTSKLLLCGFSILLAAGCSYPQRQIEWTQNNDGSIVPAPGILNRAVVAGIFYASEPFTYQGSSHEAASEFILGFSQGHFNNPVFRAQFAGVSPVFGAADYRSRFFQRHLFEDKLADTYPLISAPANQVSDGDLVDLLIEPVKHNLAWQKALYNFHSLPQKGNWNEINNVRAIVLRVVCKAYDDECFNRELRNYPCLEQAMVINGKRQPNRPCGGFGPGSEKHASIIGPINDVYGSIDNYLTVHNIPWDQECLTVTFDCDRYNGNAIPFQKYNLWLQTRPNYLPAQTLATQFYRDKGKWSTQDKAWLKYLSSQMLNPKKAMSKEEFLKNYSQ